MKNNIKEIYYAFNGRLVGNHTMKINVCEVLSLMPQEIIDYVVSNCWFFASLDDAWAFTFTGSDIKDKHLIFLSDELFSQSKNQIQYTIAHEIGHVMLGHRNSVLEKQGKGEIKKQEQEADSFAKNYL